MYQSPHILCKNSVYKIISTRMRVDWQMKQATAWIVSSIDSYFPNKTNLTSYFILRRPSKTYYICTCRKKNCVKVHRHHRLHLRFVKYTENRPERRTDNTDSQIALQFHVEYYVIQCLCAATISICIVHI